jgi:hypothetical protein
MDTEAKYELKIKKEEKGSATVGYRFFLVSWFPDSSIFAPTRPPLHQEASVSDRRLQFSSVVCLAGKKKSSQWFNQGGR